MCTMSYRILTATSAVFCGVLSFSVSAFDFSFGEFTGSLDTSISVGVAWSLEDPNRDLIGKLNIEGQQGLCDPGSGIDVLGLPAVVPDPIGSCALSNSQAFNEASGNYFTHALDDGRLNYDKHDIIAAAAKINSTLAISYENFRMVATVIAISDPVNSDFKETHPNNFSNGGAQPATTPRLKGGEDIAYNVIDLETLYFEATTEYFGRSQLWRVGKQINRLGESLLLIPNSLNSIDPPDLVRLNTPGRDLSEIFDPTSQIYLETGVTPDISMQLTYLLDYHPVRLDPAGSFLGLADFLGGGNRRAASLGIGFAREDPSNLLDTTFGAAVDPSEFGRDCFLSREGDDIQGDQYSNLNQGGHRGEMRLATDYAGRPGLAPVDSEGLLDYNQGRQGCLVQDRLPESTGQYGLSFNIFTDILGGAEFGLYYNRYHSRFPFLSGYASQLPAQTTDLSQLTDLLDGVPLVDDLVDALPTELVQVFGALKVVDTVRVQVDYPEDIDVFGASVSTNIGDYSVAAEYAYRPNLPLQIHPIDLVVGALSPAFGRLRCIAIPSFIDQYRNDYDQYTPFSTSECPDSGFAPGEYVEGFERFPVGQADAIIISLAETNPFLADQWIRVMEVGFTKVFGMPELDELQFAGGLANTTFYPGRADQDSNFDGIRDDEGAADAGLDAALAFLNLNPVQEDPEAFATSFSWGYRFANIITYEKFFGGTLELTAVFFHDVNGTSPGPGGNFIEGRKQFLISPAFKFGAYTVTGQYFGSTGAGLFNGARDRDNISLAISRTF